ncbi:MAG: acyl-CoA thioesterase [Opitutales bacterium]|nr:acyl-CoA thioesterase [Opitutales bacterium]MBP3358321.1 acyl-CoA thioesterase [Opitutales bacterium]MBQ2722690.1 acyl-CoA thioesterase [Opitutales bacterium]
MIETKTEVRVRFAETDAMGIVYHANYLPWCEVARLALINSIGLSYKTMNENGYHLPVVESHLNYKFPAKYDDIVEITARITERPSVKIKIEYEMYANGKLLVTGHTIHVFVNLQGMPVKPPRDVAKVLLDAFDKNK